MSGDANPSILTLLVLPVPRFLLFSLLPQWRRRRRTSPGMLIPAQEVPVGDCREVYTRVGRIGR